MNEKNKEAYKLQDALIHLNIVDRIHINALKQNPAHYKKLIEHKLNEMTQRSASAKNKLNEKRIKLLKILIKRNPNANYNYVKIKDYLERLPNLNELRYWELDTLASVLMDIRRKYYKDYKGVMLEEIYFQVKEAQRTNKEREKKEKLKNRIIKLKDGMNEIKRLKELVEIKNKSAFHIEGVEKEILYLREKYEEDIYLWVKNDTTIGNLHEFSLKKMLNAYFNTEFPRP